jgi:hypothetical protein
MQADRSLRQSTVVQRCALKIVVAVTLATTLIGFSGAFTSPASAASANGGIYVVTPAWWGNCPTFGVAGIAAVNSSVGFSNPGDYGDDVIWVPVSLNTWQSLQVKTICNRVGAAGGSSMYINIRPTRNKQTFFVGADSNYWAN